MMHPISEQALKKDLQWREAEGYIIVWRQEHARTPSRSRGKPEPLVGHYVLGRHENNERVSPGGKPGGWDTAQWAVVYDTYDEAVTAAGRSPGTQMNENSKRIPGTDIRILKIKRRPPIDVIEDLPFSLLDALAEI